MKSAIKAILILILAIPAIGNDGSYYTHGGVIYPTKESNISLDREILSFTVQDRTCRVDILFEFNNPDNVEKKLLVGFQAPLGGGDGVHGGFADNQIVDFKIISNGQILPFKIKAAECENCELRDPKELQKLRSESEDDSESGVFVYLFELTFKPGTNIINHSYTFPASSNICFEKLYSYILTTGAKWVGGKIKNLTVSFDLGYNKYFYVNDIFGKNAVWSIIGSGKVTSEKNDECNIDTARMVRIISGRLQIKVKDFQPKSNIEFGIINDNSFSVMPYYDEKEKQFIALKYHTLDTNKIGAVEFTTEELRLLRNTIYAQYGYVFKSKDLHDHFAKYEWYMPDPNLTMDQVKLTKEERKLIDEIVKQEKK